MKFLLDSNVVILTLLAQGDDLRRRMSEHDESDFVTSSIVFAEVMHGSVRDKPPPIEVLERFADRVPVLNFDASAARTYAQLAFERRSFDRLIAAHAMSRKLIVITDNHTDFVDVPGLKVENWTS